MTRHRVLSVAALSCAALALAGCGTFRSMGGSKVTPDEFRVVTKAPLVVPPDYSLRPPAPGEPRPQELQPESAARLALLGRRTAAQRTPAEVAFASRAGADQADPLIRFVVDDEFGDLAHKDRSFADMVLFWRRDRSPAQDAVANTRTLANTGGETPAPIDPAAEAARIQALTGGQPVIIRRDTIRATKIPGL